MKGLLALLLACLTLTAQGVEVSATGYGSTSEEALASAKTLATEFAAGTFITGHQEVDNGGLKEQTGQFNGGLLTKYVITNTTIKDGLYAVTIKADVDNSKVNTITTHAVAPLSIAPQVEKTLDEYEKTHKMFGAIDTVSPRFGVKVISTRYQAYQTNTAIIYQLKIGWSPKWVDDMGNLLSLVNRPVRQSIFSTPGVDPQDSVVCIENINYDWKLNTGNCYGVLELPPVKPEDIIIKATVSWENGEKTIETRVIPSFDVEHVLYDVNDTNHYMPGIKGQFPTLVIYAKAMLLPQMQLNYPSQFIRQITNVEFSIQ